MAEVGLRTKFRWEFAQALRRIHFDPVIRATVSVRWFKSAVVSWAVEGEEFVKTVTHTMECAAGAIDYSDRVCSLTTINRGCAHDALRDFHHPV